MTIKTILHGGPRGEPIHTGKPFNGKELLTIATYHQNYGAWKDVSSSTATITEITSPDSEGYIVITYLEVSADKNNNGSVTLQITDGINTEVLFTRKLANQPLVAEMDFSWSRVSGWKDARLEMVTSGGTFDANAFVAYSKLPEGLEYTEWDARR